MKKTHAIMFHHFHDSNKHIVGQGSIDSITFSTMLDYYGNKYNLIGAHEYLDKLLNHTLTDDDVCITFDDGLLCQYDVAFPILKKRNLTAFFFSYTSPIDGINEKLEIYRHFRSSMFKDIEEFYTNFFNTVFRMDKKIEIIMNDFDPKQYLKDFAFYTDNDRRFRYLRDKVLGQSKYYEVMDKMIEHSDYNVEKNAKLLWMKEKELIDLHNHNNIIGLHSYSHPTSMITKTKSEQEEEYALNKKQLETIIQDEVISVSYPCNSYNKESLDYMNKLGIKIGFKANMVDIEYTQRNLEIPREDHANILKQMNKRNIQI